MARGLNGSANDSGGHGPDGQEPVEARLPGGSSLPPAVAAALPAVVGVRTTVPKDRRSAQTLGTEREGHGALIDNDGLVLTIGYLIMEADTVTVTDIDGIDRPAEIVGYDYESGFGLVRTARPIRMRPLAFGDSDALADGGLRVLRVNEDSPADVAGIEAGDTIVSIDGQGVRTLEALWKTLWSGGPAERDVQLQLLRQGKPMAVTVHSVDRMKAMRRPKGV